ncbi:Transporter, MscS family protein [Ketogulonicigenium robustum]|uniref:Transporter, MscS family protein n=1 Tax=Ketogulonicigenium robustum TaxID=92947 RepID=A0A1W6NZL0_9RHOB|nr:DUF3772 domain-containing protein [Ketogulonicigenium robustum]ARO14696.1 Transporter, MscS family protein [Ketogulonicigenium robustum]
MIAFRTGIFAALLAIWVMPAIAQDTAATAEAITSESADADAEAADAAQASDDAADTARIPFGIFSGIDYAGWAEFAAHAEALVALPSPSTFALERMRSELVTWRDMFSPARDQNSERIATVTAQIAALGTNTDAANAITSRRTALQSQLAILQAPAILAGEAYAQADGLIAEIDRTLRVKQHAALLTRTDSPLDPATLTEAYSQFIFSIKALATEVKLSFQSASRQATFRAHAFPVILIAVLGVALMFCAGPASRRVRARIGHKYPEYDNVTGFLSAAARAGLQFFGVLLLTWALQTSGLFGYRAAFVIGALPMAGGLIVAVSWVGGRFFAYSRANPRPFDFTPEVRARGKRLTRELGVVMAAGILLVAMMETGDTSAAVRNAFSLPVVLFVALTLFRYGRLLDNAPQVEREGTGDGEDNRSTLLWSLMLRFVAKMAQVIAVLGPIALLIGYGRAAEWMLYPAVMTILLLGTLVALQWFVFDIFAVVLHSRDLAQNSLWPVLVAIALMIAAIPVAALIWGVRVEDMSELAARLGEGFTVGDVQLSPSGVLTFLVVFAVGYMITRLVQSTMTTTVLPRTRLDKGAQTAMLSAIRYVGLALAALLAFTLAGLNLSSLAVVAGALSVGIGFGLQTVVQNFVAGIILLAGRAIGQGDWIEVGGVSGYVREVSVRSTRIETFDRSDVIVPNATLVSGSVTNWTRGNAVGRITVAATVAYGTDPTQVMDIMRAAAEAHPMVLLSTKPAVLMTGFAADTMNFEVKALVRDINSGGTVRSDITVDIARRFNAAGIQTRNGLVPLPAAT